MTDEISAVWYVWFDALKNFVFPAGLEPNCHFAAGQIALIADFANVDPEIINTEVYRIGNTVPTDSPNFAPAGELFDAFHLFLGRIQSDELDDVKSRVAAASSQTQTGFNMRGKYGSIAPAGSQVIHIGDTQPATPSELRSVFLPGYQLNSGFLEKYQEWQTLSAQGDTTSGGTIRVSSHVEPRVTLEQVPFFRTIKITPSDPITRHESTSLSPESVLSIDREISLQPFTSTVKPEAGSATSTNTQLPLPFTFQVSFTGLGTFQIDPDRWFSNTVIKLFKSKLSQQDKDLFFGEDGVLVRRIVQVVLGFQPTLKLSFNDQTAFESAKNSYLNLADDAVGIGPFNLPSNVFITGSEGLTNYSEASQTITVGPILSTLPILLGVVSIDLVSAETDKVTKLLSVKNSGGFIASFSIQYMQSGETKTEGSGNFPSLVTKVFQLPADATNILVTVNIETFIETWSVVATYQYDKPATKSFELTGTTWDPKCKEL